jgi:hypothetical protein
MTENNTNHMKQFAYGHYRLGYSERGTAIFSKVHFLIDGKPACGTKRTGKPGSPLYPSTVFLFGTLEGCAACWKITQRNSR